MKLHFHREYETQSDKWAKVSDFVSDEVQRVHKYVVRFDVEIDEARRTRSAVTESEAARSTRAAYLGSYERRLRTLDYYNHAQIIRDIHLSALTQDYTFSPQDSDEWRELLHDVTGFRKPLKRFIREVIEDYLAYGKVGVLVDADEDVSSNRLEALENGERSYFVKFPAASILDWKRFARGPLRGQFSRVLLQEENVSLDGQQYESFLELTLDVGERYEFRRYRAKESRKKFSAHRDGIDVELFEEGQGGLYRIPFVVMGEGIGESALYGVVNQSEVRLNKQSELDNILYYQAFRRTLLSGVSPQEAVAFAENTVAYTESENARLQSEDPTEPNALKEEVRGLDRRIFRRGLKERHMQADDTRQVQSAASKAKDSDSLVDWYHTVVDELEAALNDALALQAEFQGFQGANAEPSMVFSRSFAAEDTEAEAMRDSMLFSQASSIGALEVQKEIVKRGLASMPVIPTEGQTPEERRAEIFASVDAASPGGRRNPLSESDLFGEVDG